MTPTDNLTSAFECLWEAKIYLLRTVESTDDDMRTKLRIAVTDVAATRDRIEKLLIELQEKPAPAPGPRSE